jgi:biopolymer transport protein ExbD
LIDGKNLTPEPLPISEKRSKVIWQSKDKFAYIVVNAKGQIYVDVPRLLSVDELRDLEYALNQFLQGPQ